MTPIRLLYVVHSLEPPGPTFDYVLFHEINSFESNAFGVFIEICNSGSDITPDPYDVHKTFLSHLYMSLFISNMLLIHNLSQYVGCDVRRGLFVG